MFSDQFYWSRRVRELGIGSAVAFSQLSADALAAALQKVLEPTRVAHARCFAAKVITDGAAIAARRLAEELG